MSRILKVSESTQAQAGRYSFDDWGSDAGQAVATQNNAEQMLSAARCEAERIRAEAREQGLASAMSEFDALVEQAATLKFEAWLPTLQAAVMQVAASKTSWLAQWEASALRVAIAISERVLRREIERTPEVALTLVRETLELSTTGEAKLLLHPEDIRCLGPQLESLLAELGRTATVSLVADDTITRGGCRLDTRLGSIDQQLEAQLARIEEELR
jgi:flagellar assembly protein FliH